mmetsp:Transcript_27024/g.39991  ORF Transcript_27024/g.39991 Transcript_27024/m.39991 type:complete len:283 (-) Transcript_27024:104-952(-)
MIIAKGVNAVWTMNPRPRLCLRSFLITAASFSYSTDALNICIISGSTRTNGPPRPILSDRVTSFIESSISSRREISGDNNEIGQRMKQHHISTLNAKSIALLERPHFTYPPSQMPSNLQDMHQTLNSADAYIIITPEYNHSPCPGLLNLLNHFGSSTFSFKPSGIVSYSAGQWGGTRAAHSLRPFLSELGCLPVSAMVHIPNAGDILDENGKVNIDSGKDLEDGIDSDNAMKRWEGYTDRMMTQLEWWGQAAKNQRDSVDPLSRSPAFQKSPSERNAPGRKT